MKFFLLIFNLYVLVLPCIPCGDVEVCVNEIAITSQLQKESNHKEEHKDDTCTPFCHCTCCTTSIIFTAIAAPKTAISYFKKQQYVSLSTDYMFNNHHAIWQPPKLIVA